MRKGRALSAAQPRQKKGEKIKNRLAIHNHPLGHCRNFLVVIIREGKVMALVLLRYCFLTVAALQLFGSVVSVPENTKPFLEPPQHIRNASSMWLDSPHPGNNNNDRTSSAKKRKHEEEVNSEDEVTLCWPNTLLRECKEVTVSKESYMTLHYHHAGYMKECFCVLEGFDTVESDTTGPLFIDGRVFDTFPRYVVTTYRGDPLPHLDISFPDSSIDSDPTSEDSGAASVVLCWPNPLLGECKEAEISNSELDEILTGKNGNDLDLDVCSCASGGFKSAKKDSNDKNDNSEERYTGVRAYSPSPRVTMCFFEGQSPGHGIWEGDNGVKIQKGELCKQVTIDRTLLYHAKKNTLIKTDFNEGGVFECSGGCPGLGYSVILQGGSRQQRYLTSPLLTGKAAGRRQMFHLVYWRDRNTSPGEWVYTYHTEEYTPRVTLCFFGGKEREGGPGTDDANSENQWWRTNDGGVVRKRQYCKQVTMSREMYSSRARVGGSASERKERFNEYGIYECGEGGCGRLGYSVLKSSKEVSTIKLQQVKPVSEQASYSGDVPKKKTEKKEGGGRPSKYHTFNLTPRNNKEREELYTYMPTPRS